MKAKNLLLLMCVYVLASCDKGQTARSIYEKTPAITYSMTEEEEAERMKGVIGCYGLSLDETSKKKARAIMKKQGANFESGFLGGGCKVFEGLSEISSKIETPKNIETYRSEIKHGYDKSTYIYMLFVNDTLSQIAINVYDRSYYLENDLIEKYGVGNGQKKETQFGKDKEGNINLNDIALGYEFRQWQNERIVIDWPYDRYLPKLSNERIKWNPSISTNDNTAIYTSKKMAKRIIHYYKKAYEEYKNKKDKESSERIGNL